MPTTPQEDYINLYLQPTIDPILSSTEISQIIELSKRNDKYNRIPTNTDWTPTYDLNWAVAQGFQVKAAKASGDYHFENEGLKFYREQIIANCTLMADRFLKKSTSNVKFVPIENIMLKAGTIERV